MPCDQCYLHCDMLTNYSHTYKDQLKLKYRKDFFKVSMARNQKLSYKMNMFHFLTKQNYSKYSQISMSMSFS